jgi:hypothetical protein
MEERGVNAGRVVINHLVTSLVQNTSNASPRIGTMLDNQDVAVFTKLNELAERRGLKPYDFVATLQSQKDRSYTLNFEVPAQGNALREERYDKMLKDLGIVRDDKAALNGSTKDIIDALDNALSISPRPRISL